MTSFKDHFSGEPANYQKYRPQYPHSLFQWLASSTQSNDLAWDCATGNGQAAVSLSTHFQQVIATDGSQQQIESAMVRPNVHYAVARETCAEIGDATVDLITVAQALHWFDTSVFFKEADRVLRPGGLLAVWSYNLLKIESAIDDLLSRFYYETLGAYWPAERRLVEQGYESISMPFTPFESPDFEMIQHWRREHLLGYLSTWSAVKRYRENHADDPFAELADKLSALWPENEVLTVRWPLTVRTTRKTRMM